MGCIDNPHWYRNWMREPEKHTEVCRQGPAVTSISLPTQVCAQHSYLIVAHVQSHPMCGSFLIMHVCPLPPLMPDIAYNTWVGCWPPTWRMTVGTCYKVVDISPSTLSITHNLLARLGRLTTWHIPSWNEKVVDSLWKLWRSLQLMRNKVNHHLCAAYANRYHDANQSPWKHYSDSDCLDWFWDL